MEPALQGTSDGDPGIEIGSVVPEVTLGKQVASDQKQRVSGRIVGLSSQSLVHRLQSGRPACDDPNASRMRSVGTEVDHFIFTLLMTDRCNGNDSFPCHRCLAGVWCWRIK